MGDFIKTDRYEIYNHDCIDMLDLLITEGRQVDLTVTSPPYDDLRDYEKSLVWNFDVFKQVADRLYKITKDGGTVVWVVNDRVKNGGKTLTSFKQALYFQQIGFSMNDVMIYEKTNPMPNTNSKRYTQSFEYMFILSKGKQKTFNPLMEMSKYGGEYTFGSPSIWNKNGELIKKEKRKINEYKKKSNIFYYTVGSTVSKNKQHPAVFPEKLAEDHILSWSNEGDIVLDCFMGSCTTGKMALLNNRKFIGIEKVEDYFEISKERIENLA